MKHDTSSPVEEAIEWAIGTGNGVWLNKVLVPSYVVKNAPASNDE